MVDSKNNSTLTTNSSTSAARDQNPTSFVQATTPDTQER